MSESDNIHWAHTTDAGEMKGDELFQDIWQRTESIPGSYTRLNAAKLYEYARKVPMDGTIVEVGVDQGRSASILMRIVELTGTRVFLVDSWESVLVDNYFKVLKLRDEFPEANVAVWHMKSVDAAYKLVDLEPNLNLDMVHVDANHYTPNIENDCLAWLPMLKSGGVALFHDVGSTFDAVTEAVRVYTEGWENLGNWDSLAVRRKP